MSAVSHRCLEGQGGTGRAGFRGQLSEKEQPRQAEAVRDGCSPRADARPSNFAGASPIFQTRQAASLTAEIFGNKIVQKDIYIYS